ncbi:MAG: tetratricopeptide repeat protein [Nitrospira sp. SB0666_bin_27]|nr:tetratricopeptide repeat protein [Nitrospira sp. SB0666_bin_27]MYC27959.1 tetratricopeptide repeat protein [Nitrospira sp. SB0662_bin_26]MYF24294.1 tetratricopeptide repeat protein [Nitrospira sp. SB0678_bin_10]
MMQHIFRLILLTSFVAFVALVGFGIGTAVAGGPPALMTSPDSKAHAANNEGIEHYNQEHWDVALGHFIKAVEADPASAEAHYNLALALDKTDKHMEAANEFKMAQDIGKDNPDIQNSKILLGHVKMLKKGM